MSADTGQTRQAVMETGAAGERGAKAGQGAVEQIVFSLDHPIDTDAMYKAWLKLLERHPQLLAAASSDEISDNTAATDGIEVMDWRSDVDDDVRRARLDELMRRAREEHNATAPAFRLFLVRWDEGSWRCLCMLQRELLDWRSLSIILRELIAHYHASLHGVSPPSHTTRIVTEFRNWLDAASARNVEPEFWRDYLHGMSLPFSLDLVSSEPSGKDASDACVERRLDIARSESVRRLRKAADVTMNNLVEASWALLLSRYQASDDTLFGIVRSCRHSLPPGVEDALGSFVNTVPLRLSVDRNSNVFELLWHARDQHRKVREHECSPVDAIAACVPSASGPLFDTALEFDLRDPMRSLEEVFGDSGPYDFEHRSSTPWRMHLQVYGEDEILVRLRFRPEQVDRATAERVAEQFCNLLVAMAREPWMPLKDIPFLSEEDSAPCRWPGPQRQRVSGKARTIHGIFEDQVHASPDAIAVCCDGESITYGELNSRANRLAHALRRAGVQPDQLVGLCTERSIEQIVGILGILKSGAGYLPLDPAYPAERLGFMLDDAGVRFVVATDEAREHVPAGDHSILPVDAQGRPADDENPVPRGGANDLAYVIYTSGSTGKPKGVMVEHHNVVRLFDACEGWLNAGIGDAWTMFHSFAFDFSVWEIWGALLHGGRLEIVPLHVARSPDAFHDLLVERNVTVLSQTPSAFRQLAGINEEREAELPALRLVVFGGEKLDFADLRDWMERHGDEQPRLVNMYGITETTVHVTYRPLLQKDIREGNASCIGWPLPDLYVRLLDADGHPVPPGVRGEICVGGAGVTRGYLNRPQLTGERFVVDPLDPDARLYRSGDFARLLPNGELAYIGRQDDQVKISGFRIDLGEVIAALRDVPGIEQGTVVARGEPGGQRLVAYYVAGKGEDLGVGKLRKALAERLPAHMIPSAFVAMDELPMNANNKIDTKSLPDPSEAAAARERDVRNAMTDVEQALCGIWQELLGHREVGRSDDFFALGGDDMLANALAARAHAAGIELSPHDVRRYPVLADLAAQAGRHSAASRETGVADDGVLTPMQAWFFEQRFENADRYNQSCMFRVPPETNVDAIECALLAVVERHEALRLRFMQDEQGRWRSKAVDVSEAVEFSRIELDHLEHGERIEAMALITDDIQSSLSLSAGLLVRAAHFTGGVEEGDRLFIAIHSLAMDVASWGVLMQDLDRAYHAIIDGREPDLPAAAISSREWAARLAQHARSSAVAGEQAYWENILEAGCGEPFETMRKSRGHESNARTHTVRLEAADTAAMLGEAQRAYGNSPQEIMLAALAKSINDKWPACAHLRVDLLRHERDVELANINAADAIGNFSVLQPLALDQSCAGNASRLLCAVKESVRSAPHGGIGWGALRYLRDAEPGARQSSRPAPFVFEYVGNVERALGSHVFQHVLEDAGADRGPDNHLAWPVAVRAARRDDRLEFEFRHDPSVLPEGEVRQVAERFVEAMHALLEHCRAQRDALRTPADFPMAQMSQQELDAFPLALEHVEEILPLSPSQQLHGGDGENVNQWVFTLEGDIDEQQFEAAWQELCRRHDALRTVFVEQGLSEPRQVVFDAVDFRLQRSDWRRMNEDAQQERLAAFLASDRRQGFEEHAAPRMRATLIRLTDRRWLLAWTHDRALIDGWSWPVLAEELGELHDAGVEGRPAELPPAGSSRSYIAWLADRDTDEYARFWKSQLGSPSERMRLTRASVDGERGAHEVMSLQLPSAAAEKLDALARRLRLTPGLVFQAAWALLLSGLTRRFNVTAGIALSGRTAALPLPQNTVGSFVNELPVHIDISPTERIDQWLAGLRAVQADVNHYQNVLPTEIAEWSGDGHRQFDALFVFRGYASGKAVQRFGKRIRVRDVAISEPARYPLVVSVTPANGYCIEFQHDPRAIDVSSVRALADDLRTILQAMAENPDVHVSTVMIHVTRHEDMETGLNDAARQTTATPASGGGNSLEETIARVCCEVLGIDDIDHGRNFFDAGAQSVTLIEIHERLQKKLDRRFPVVRLFQHASVQALATWLDEESRKTSDNDSSQGEATRRGAERRAALMRRRQARQPGNLER